MSTFEEIKEFISDNLEDVEVTPDLVLKDHLDSLEIYEAVFQIEGKYGFTMPNDKVSELITVQDLVNLIEELK